jgi:hypothetical protein
MPTMTDLGNVLIKDMPKDSPAPRLAILFDEKTLTIYPANTIRKTSKNWSRDLILLRFTRKPAKTPTGGRYVARRLLVRHQDGTRWVGTMRKDSDIVTLRPEPKS